MKTNPATDLVMVLILAVLVVAVVVYVQAATWVVYKEVSCIVTQCMKP